MSGQKDIKALKVRIEGRVQGVWFRAWAVQEASARGLWGWVRNRHDGCVEALFAGPPATVDEMVALCHRGPPAARVTMVHAEAAAIPVDNGFLQLPSA
jgi:acylphosphatase